MLVKVKIDSITSRTGMRGPTHADRHFSDPSMTTSSRETTSN